MSSLKLKTPSGGSVTFNATDTVSDVTLTVPASNASLLTDSSNIPAANLTGSLPVGMGGKVLQVVQYYDKQQSSYTMLNINNGYTNYGLNENGIDLTTLDSVITPSSTNSKILVMTNIMFWAAPPAYGVFRLKRGIGTATPTYASSDPWMSAMNSVPGTLTQMGSTGISTNGDTSWYGRILNFNFLDSPNTTDTVKYRFNFRMEGDPDTTFWLNRAGYNTNDYGANAGISSIILMEVAG